jgi:hypothetical protein
MTAFVQMGYNDVPRKCSTIDLTVYDISDNEVSVGSDYSDVRNLFYGGSSIFYRNSNTEVIAKTKINLTLVDKYPAQSINYFAIKGVNLLFESGATLVTVTVSATDGINSNSESVSFNSTALIGSFGEDYIHTFAEWANTYSEFEITIETDIEIPHKLRKFYLGKLYTFDDKSPFYPYSPDMADNGTPFTADTGSRYKTSMGRRGKILGFNWRGLTDAQKLFIDANIRPFLPDFPVFLYEPNVSDHTPLGSAKLLFGWAEMRIATKEWKDNNQISLSFFEDITG